MKHSNRLKPILFILCFSLLVGISLRDAVAGPLIIVTKTQCTGRAGGSAYSNLRRFFLTLNPTTASWYWNTNNNPAGFLYLYYRATANDPWQVNGIPCTGTANGGFNYIVPIPTGATYEIMLATGSTSASLGSNGSGPNQKWMKITGCRYEEIDKAGSTPDPRLIRQQ